MIMDIFIKIILILGVAGYLYRSNLKKLFLKIKPYLQKKKSFVDNCDCSTIIYTLDATYKELVTVLGMKHHNEGDGYKNSTLWNLKHKPTKLNIEICDRKATTLFHGEEKGIPTPEELREKNIEIPWVVYAPVKATKKQLKEISEYLKEMQTQIDLVKDKATYSQTGRLRDLAVIGVRSGLSRLAENNNLKYQEIKADWGGVYTSVHYKVTGSKLNLYRFHKTLEEL